MTELSPLQLLAQDVRSLQSRIGAMQDSVRLTALKQKIGEVHTGINNLDQQVTELRTRGYVFGKGLESTCKEIEMIWSAGYANLLSQVSTQSSTLTASLRPLEMKMTQLNALAGNPISARPLLISMQAAAQMLEEKITAVEKSLIASFSTIEIQYTHLSAKIHGIDFMLKQLTEATFKLYPTEGGIGAVKAVWCRSGKEEKGDPEGILFLTDQRLIFEQKEEIATRKVLFVATEKQKVHQLLLEYPVAQVEKVDTSRQGLLKTEDHISISLSPQADRDSAHFHIWQENALWQQMINRAKTKDFDQDRAIGIDKTAVEQAAHAPTQCPNCGSNINQEILRGMDRITCEYCGTVIRL